MSNWLLTVECFTVFQLILDAQVHHSSPSWRPSFFPVGGPGVVAIFLLAFFVSGGGLPSPSSGWRRALSPLGWCPSIPQRKNRQAAPPRERGGRQHHQKEGAYQDARPKGAREACTTAQKEEVGTHHFSLPLFPIELLSSCFFFFFFGPSTFRSVFASRKSSSRAITWFLCIAWLASLCEFFFLLGRHMCCDFPQMFCQSPVCRLLRPARRSAELACWSTSQSGSAPAVQGFLFWCEYRHRRLLLLWTCVQLLDGRCHLFPFLWSRHALAAANRLLPLAKCPWSNENHGSATMLRHPVHALFCATERAFEPRRDVVSRKSTLHSEHHMCPDRRKELLYTSRSARVIRDSEDQSEQAQHRSPRVHYSGNRTFWELWIFEFCKFLKNDFLKKKKKKHGHINNFLFWKTLLKTHENQKNSCSKGLVRRYLRITLLST